MIKINEFNHKNIMGNVIENDKLFKNFIDDDLKNTIVIETTITNILGNNPIYIYCSRNIENNHAFSDNYHLTLFRSHPNFNELFEKLIIDKTYKFTFKYTYKTRHNTIISIDDATKYNIVGMVKSFVPAHKNYYKIIISCDKVLRSDIIVHKNDMIYIMVNGTYQFTLEKYNRYYLVKHIYPPKCGFYENK